MTELTTEEACRMAENLNRSEFNYLRSLLTNAHDYFNPEMDVAGMVCREKALLRALAEGVGRRFLVRTDNPLRYPELVLRVMRDHADPVPN